MYIRTKNRIYKVESTLRDNGFVKGYNVGYMAFITKDQVINQSENLEELCDQIVYNGYLYQNKITCDGSLVEDSFEELEEPITDEMIKEGVYGAIWTNKGLIYVAKINESGDLELI